MADGDSRIECSAGKWTTTVGGATETMSIGDSRMECSAGEWNYFGGWGYSDYDSWRQQDEMLFR
jgi:hypothetical protein